MIAQRKNILIACAAGVLSLFLPIQSGSISGVTATVSIMEALDFLGILMLLSLGVVALLQLLGNRAEPLHGGKRFTTVALGFLNLMLSLLILSGGVMLTVVAGEFNGDTGGLMHIGSSPSIGILLNSGAFVAITYFALFQRSVPRDPAKP